LRHPRPRAQDRQEARRLMDAVTLYDGPSSIAS
jgi:hypothetical protein